MNQSNTDSTYGVSDLVEILDDVDHVGGCILRVLQIFQDPHIADGIIIYRLEGDWCMEEKELQAPRITFRTDKARELYNAARSGRKREKEGWPGFQAITASTPYPLSTSVFTKALELVSESLSEAKTKAFFSASARTATGQASGPSQEDTSSTSRGFTKPPSGKSKKKRGW